MCLKDLISGNVNKVSYQKGKPDYIAHSYDYDELNRLTEVHTTTNDVHKTQEAHYRYYDYGPMARTEIGEYKVQGMDFAFTINGWLKGMNASSLNISNDMGKDGSIGYLPNNNAVHSEFARDVLAYTLGYFDSDYKAIGASTMEATYAGTAFGNGSSNLYNGNIRHSVMSIADLDPMGSTYKYDQINRLKEVRAFYNVTLPSTNGWAGITSTDDYYTSLEYDRNGNILHLKRNGTVASGLLMDDFTYNYTTVSGNPSNRLDKVVDAGANDATNVGDIKAGMTAGNYQYDALGALLSDASEGLTLEWRRGDKKVKCITHTVAKPDAPIIEFVYNPFGQRIIKVVKPRTGGVLSPQTDWKYNYYIYDANEQVMGIYGVTMSSTINKADLQERNIYGADRFGINKENIDLYNNGIVAHPTLSIVQNTIGNRLYELTDHLGSVKAVINDRKIVDIGGTSSLYKATLIQVSDHYAFGMTQTGRHQEFTSDKFRFGYNGMEKDKEIKGDGNSYTTEFRQYDPRLGRWLSLDPLMAKFPWMSPYVAFDNNPIYYKDPYGLSATNDGEKKPKVYKNPRRSARNWIRQNVEDGNIEKGAKIKGDKKTGNVTVTYTRIIKKTTQEEVTMPGEGTIIEEVVIVSKYPKTKTFVKEKAKDKKTWWERYVAWEKADDRRKSQADRGDAKREDQEGTTMHEEKIYDPWVGSIPPGVGNGHYEEPEKNFNTNNGSPASKGHPPIANDELVRFRVIRKVNSNTLGDPNETGTQTITSPDPHSPAAQIRYDALVKNFPNAVYNPDYKQFELRIDETKK